MQEFHFFKQACLESSWHYPFLRTNAISNVVRQADLATASEFSFCPPRRASHPTPRRRTAIPLTTSPFDPEGRQARQRITNDIRDLLLHARLSPGFLRSQLAAGLHFLGVLINQTDGEPATPATRPARPGLPGPPLSPPPSPKPDPSGASPPPASAFSTILAHNFAYDFAHYFGHDFAPRSAFLTRFYTRF